jgi:hypothetical protein
LDRIVVFLWSKVSDRDFKPQSSGSESENSLHPPWLSPVKPPGLNSGLSASGGATPRFVAVRYPRESTKEIPGDGMPR